MTKQPAAEKRIAPLDYETELAPELGIGVRRFHGGVHYLEDHVTFPVEGEPGDWHTIGGAPGYEYRETMCECGHQVLEGRIAERDDPLPPEIPVINPPEIPPPAEPGE